MTARHDEEQPSAAEKCVMMGGAWVCRHPQSGLLEFLILFNEFKEDFERCWEERREYWLKDGDQQLALPPVTKDAPGSALAATVAGKTADGKPAGKADTKPPNKAAKGGSNKKEQEKDDTPEKAAKEARAEQVKQFNTLVKGAQKVKGTYLQNMAVLTDLEKQTADWSGSSKVTKLLKKGLDMVQPRISAWHQKWVLSDDKEWQRFRQGYSHERNVTELRAWVEFQADVEQMGRIAQSLQTAHEAIGEL